MSTQFNLQRVFKMSALRLSEIFNDTKHIIVRCIYDS